MWAQSLSWQHAVRNAAPCLIKTRMARQGYYIPKLRRRLLPEEAAALQAVPSPVFAAMTAAAKDNNIPLSAVAGSLGDAMSVNVLASVLMRGLNHAPNLAQSKTIGARSRRDHLPLI